MTYSKLILIEGIPGSGKTPTARFVYDWLRQNGEQPLLFWEGDMDHPDDYESVACLDKNEYLHLRSTFPEQAGLLASLCTKNMESSFSATGRCKTSLVSKCRKLCLTLWLDSMSTIYPQKNTNDCCCKTGKPFLTEQRPGEKATCLNAVFCRDREPVGSQDFTLCVEGGPIPTVVIIFNKCLYLSFIRTFY